MAKGQSPSRSAATRRPSEPREENGPSPAAYRAAHPQPKALFILLRPPPEVDRRYVLVAARSRSIDAASPRAQLTLNALRACLADKHRLSRTIYDSWRAAQPSPTEWPSSQMIINTFRTWRRALDAAGA